MSRALAAAAKNISTAADEIRTPGLDQSKPACKRSKKIGQESYANGTLRHKKKWIFLQTLYE